MDKIMLRPLDAAAPLAKLPRALSLGVALLWMLFPVPRVNAQTGDGALNAARSLIAERKYDEAIVALSAVKAQSVADAPEAQRLIGTCYQGKKDFFGAIDAYNEVLRIYPESTAAAETYFWIGLCQEAQGATDAAILAFSRQAALFPSNKRTGPAILKWGERLQSKGEYEAALDRYHLVSKNYVDQAPRACLLTGICYQDRRMYAKAATVLEAGANAYPTAGDTLRETKYRRLECLLAGKFFDEAIAAAKQLTDEFPNDADRHLFSLGLAYQGAKEYSQALVTFQSVADRFPLRPKARESLLRVEECLRAERKFEEDLKFLSGMELRDDMREEALIRRSEVFYEGLNRWPEAIESLQLVIRDYPTSRFAIEAEARIAEITLYGLRDYAAAAAQLRSFREAHPDYDLIIDVEQSLGMTEYLQKRYKEAASIFLEGTKLPDPANYRALMLYMAANCHEKLGDTAQAKAIAEELVRCYPDDCWAKLARGRYQNDASASSEEARR